MSDALISACFDGDIDKVRELLSAGADPFEAYLGDDAMTAAVEGGNCNVVLALIAAGMPVDRRSEEGRTALMTAAWTADAALVSMLLDLGADVDARDYKGRTALMLASDVNDPDVLGMLIRAGADEDAVDHDGKTANDHALRRGHPMLAA